MSFTDIDPGRGWRRTMRCGVLLAIIVFLVEWAVDMSPMRAFSGMAEVSRTGEGPFWPLHSDSPLGCWLFRIFCCTFLTVFLSTPLYAFICSPLVLRSGPVRLPFFAAAVVLWSVALIPPYFFGVNQLALVENKDIAALGLGLLSLSLLLGAITMLNGWRKRAGPELVFWLGLYPIATGVVSLACFLISVSLAGGLQTGYFLIPLIGLLLAILLLTAWLKWWSAVSAFERENKPTARCG